MTTSATKTSSRRNSGKRKRSRHWQPPGNARNTLATCCCRWILYSIPRRGTTPTRKRAARLRMAWGCCMRQACLWIAGWTQTMRWVALHCETSPTTRPSFPVSALTRCPAHLATPLQHQVLSQVSGGAHLVLHARLRHAPAASKSTTHALKVVPMHEIRQIQREVRVCQHRRRMRAWRGLRLTDPPWHVGHDPQPRAASVHHARASCVCGCHPCVRQLRWPWFVRMTPHSHTNNARRLGGDRYIQLPWCSGGDMKAWLESRTPQRTVAEACLVLHDILRVRG